MSSSSHDSSSSAHFTPASKWEKIGISIGVLVILAIVKGYTADSGVWATTGGVFKGIGLSLPLVGLVWLRLDKRKRFRMMADAILAGTAALVSLYLVSLVLQYGAGKLSGGKEASLAYWGPLVEYIYPIALLVKLAWAEWLVFTDQAKRAYLGALIYGTFAAVLGTIFLIVPGAAPKDAQELGRWGLKAVGFNDETQELVDILDACEDAATDPTKVPPSPEKVRKASNAVRLWADEQFGEKKTEAYTLAKRGYNAVLENSDASRRDKGLAHSGLSMIAHSEGDWDTAMSESKAAVKEAPAFGTLHWNLGDLAESQASYAEALSAYQMALHFGHDDAETRRAIKRMQAAVGGGM